MPYADKEVRRAHCREYQKTDAGKAAHAAANKRYRQKNRQRLAAHNAVAKAIARGKMAPWPVCAVPDCECAPEAHHPDYSRPLDVVWLCDTHHKAAHKLGREIERSLNG